MSAVNIQKKIGAKIREIRKKSNLTQQQVCTDKLSLRNYQLIESGGGNLTVKTLLAISEKLQVHPGDFFDFEWQGKIPSKK